MTPLDKVNVSEISEKVNSFFSPEDLEEMARDSGFVQRSSKFDGSTLVQSLVLMPGNPYDFRLKDYSKMVGSTYGVEISAQGLDQRFNEGAVGFMREVFSRLLGCELNTAGGLDCLKAFDSVRLEDWTGFQLPPGMAEKYPGSGGSGSEAGLKIFFDYDFKLRDKVNIEVAAFKSKDSEHFSPSSANELRIGDLAYSTIGHMKEIDRAGGTFAYRFATNTKAFVKDLRGNMRELSLEKVLGKMREGETWEYEAFLGARELLPVRLVIEKVPEKVAEQRRRRIKAECKRKGKQPKKRTLLLCGGGFFITNAPKSKIPASVLRQVYRIRWQIEIMFKVWKSIFHLDKVKKVKTHRMQVVLYATLVKILLFMHIFSWIKIQAWNQSKIEISELKAYSTLEKETANIQFLIAYGMNQHLDRLLTNLFHWILKHDQKRPDPECTSHLQFISEIPLA